MKLIHKLFAIGAICVANTSSADYRYFDLSNEPQTPVITCKQNPVTAIAEYLFWRPSQTGMTYCVSLSDFETSPVSAKTKAIQQTANWDSGFRVGIAADLPQIPGALAIMWTRFHEISKSTSSDPFIIGTQLGGIGSGFMIGGAGVDAGKPQSKWNLGIDIVEADLGYDWGSNDCFLLTPYVGVVAGIIDQTQTITYNNFFDTDNAAFFDAQIKQKNDFRGIGPKLGIKGSVVVGKGISLTGNLAASFFYGNSRSPVKFSVQGDPIGFPLPETRVNYHKLRVLPSLQAQVGFNFCLYREKQYALEFAASYEVQYFMNTWRNQNSQNQNLFTSDVGYGDLTLQGLTASFTLKF
jgi:hypothetical protein